jgi:hypothetical protein
VKRLVRRGLDVIVRACCAYENSSLAEKLPGVIFDATDAVGWWAWKAGRRVYMTPQEIANEQMLREFMRRAADARERA